MFNKFGCDSEYHPNACFEAMKSKTCQNNECEFFQILGTKKWGLNCYPDQHCSSSLVFHKAKEPWEVGTEKMAEQMEKMMQWQLNQALLHPSLPQSLPLFLVRKYSFT